MKESAIPRRYELGVSSIPPVEERQDDSTDDAALDENSE